MEEKIVENTVDVNTELQLAIAKAKEFHPVNKLYVDGYTGEVSRYKTPDNYVPDEGVVNSKPDLCHTEDHVTIAQMYNRLKNMKALSIMDSDWDIDERNVNINDLDEDTISDIVSTVDDPSDYENIVNPMIQETFGKPSDITRSDSAGQNLATESKIEEVAPEVATTE